MSQDRITLALAACAGMSDQELAKRGTGSFAAMIKRKRDYAFSARLFKTALDNAQEQYNVASASLATLEQLEQPVEDVSEAAGLLALIAAK